MPFNSIFPIRSCPGVAHSKPISDEQLKSCLEKEGIQIWVNSFGGCGSNMLLDHFESYGYRVRGRVYNDWGCHFSHPVEIKGAKAVYIYGNPFKSIISQHRRDILALNLHKANNYVSALPCYLSDFSDLDIKPFHDQFKNWTKTNKIGSMDIIQIKYETLWEDWYAIQSFLNYNIPPPPKKERFFYEIGENQKVNLFSAIKVLEQEISNFKTDYF